MALSPEALLRNVRTAALVLAVGFTSSVAGAQPLASDAGAAGASITLFKGYSEACYRIPALAGSGAGSLIAVVERRYGLGGARAAVDTPSRRKLSRCTDSGSIDLVARLSKDGGRSWGEERTIVDHRDLLEPDYKVALAGNPTLVRQGERIILIFSMARSKGGQNSVRCVRFKGKDKPDCDMRAEQALWMTRSADDGVSWSKPEPMNFPDGGSRIKIPGPGHGLALASGRLVAPAYPRLLLSDDDGRTWREGATTNGHSLQGGETAIGSLGGDMLWASLRPTGASFRRRGDGKPFRIQAISADGGETYRSIEVDERFSMPPVMPGLAIFDSTWILSHPVSDAETNGRAKSQHRRRLTLSISKDDGHTWRSCLLDPGGAGYSDLAALDRGAVALAYEGSLDAADEYRAAVKFRTIPVDGYEDLCVR